MSETAYKVVDADLRSAFLPWLDGRITYSVGDSFDAEGIAICGPAYAGVPIADPVNAQRGIMVIPELDRCKRSAWYLEMCFPDDPPRFLEVAYDDADVLGVIQPGFYGALSVANIAVVAEVTP